MSASKYVQMFMGPVWGNLLLLFAFNVRGGDRSDIARPAELYRVEEVDDFHNVFSLEVRYFIKWTSNEI